MSKLPPIRRNEPVVRDSGVTDGVMTKYDRSPSGSKQQFPVLLFALMGGMGFCVCLLGLFLMTDLVGNSTDSSDAGTNPETQLGTTSEPRPSRPTLAIRSTIQLNAGEQLEFQVPLEATPEVSSDLEYTMVSGPTHSRIERNSGRISWNPTVADEGREHLFVIRVAPRSAADQFSQQAYRVSVANRTAVVPSLRLSLLFTYKTDARINDACFSPDSQQLVLGRREEIIRLATPAGKRLSSIDTNFMAVKGLGFSHDGKLLFAADSQLSSGVTIWEFESSRLVDRAQFPVRVLTDLVVTQDDDRLLLGGYPPRRVVVGDWRDGTLTATRTIPTVPQRPVGNVFCALSPDGQTCAAVHGDGMIYLYDSQTLAPRGQLGDYGPRVNGLAFFPSGDSLASVHNDGAVRTWDLSTKRQQSRVSNDFMMAGSVACSPDGKYIAASGRLPDLPSMAVKVWSAETGMELAFQRPGLWNTSEDPLLFSPDGRYLVVAGNDDNGGLAVGWKLLDGPTP